MINRIKIIASVLLVFACNYSVQSEEASTAKPTFAVYLAALKQEAIAKGYDSSLVDAAFADTRYHKKVVKADKNQPEFVETLDTYLPKRVPEWKVAKARKLYQENLPLLVQVSNQYGVQPRFIIALWGLESSFGQYTGGYNVISALTTLAYDGRREAFFKRQIWAALEIQKQGHIDAAEMKGSWAGAMGQTQFMPTSFLAYAVDFDGDGKKDIWTSKADAFASIANYLKSEGWNGDLTWGRQVKLPEQATRDWAIKKNTGTRANWLKAWDENQKPLSEWQAMGIRRTDGADLPKRELKAALLMPDDAQGRAYLAYDNYKSLMHWNRSYYFVTSVGYLSDRIRYPRIH